MGAAHKIREKNDVELEPRTQKRRTARANTYLCIDVCSNDNFWTGLTMNLSEGGVFVATHEVLRAGTLVGIHLELPNCKRVLGLGEVRWTRAYSGDDDVPPGIGIQFVGLDLETTAAIRKYLTSISEPLIVEH